MPCSCDANCPSPLSKDHCGLKELALTNNALNDGGVASLAGILPMLPQLRELKLGFNLLG